MLTISLRRNNVNNVDICQKSSSHHHPRYWIFSLSHLRYYWLPPKNQKSHVHFFLEKQKSHAHFYQANTRFLSCSVFILYKFIVHKNCREHCVARETLNKVNVSAISVKRRTQTGKNLHNFIQCKFLLV